VNRMGLVPVLLATVVAAAGCGGSSAPSQVHTAPARTVHVSEKQNGATVHAHVGDTVVVTLHNTYWTLASVHGGVLAPLAAGGPSPGGSGCPHIPGTGCGVVMRGYHVQQAGSATLAAHRTSCGEALRCTAKTGSWRVTVVAS
jgi:hypothetical protein